MFLTVKNLHPDHAINASGWGGFLQCPEKGMADGGQRHCTCRDPNACTCTHIYKHTLQTHATQACIHMYSHSPHIHKYHPCAHTTHVHTCETHALHTAVNHESNQSPVLVWRPIWTRVFHNEIFNGSRSNQARGERVLQPSTVRSSSVLPRNNHTARMRRGRAPAPSECGEHATADLPVCSSASQHPQGQPWAPDGTCIWPPPQPANTHPLCSFSVSEK